MHTAEKATRPRWPEREARPAEAGRSVHREYVAKTKPLRAEARRSSRQARDQLAKAERSLVAIIRSVEPGAWNSSLNERLVALEAEKLSLKAGIEAPDGHPAVDIVGFYSILPLLYRQGVDEPQTSSKDETVCREALAILRTPIEKVAVTAAEAGVEVAL